ncbi:MAG: MFS transporter, partial [Eubacteriales bacterium]|nr:MFS transporter [Eubacteriales bacterium]
WAWGWILAALVAYLLIPVFGWRVALWVGAVPALFAAYLRRSVPESPRYLESSGKGDEADRLIRIMEEEAGVEEYPHETHLDNREQDIKVRLSLAELWSGRYMRSTAVLWVIWFGINFGYYGFVLWTPSLLVAQGFALVKSFEFTLIMCLAQLPGYFSAAYLVEKIGRKPVLTIYFAGTALAAWLFGHGDSTTQILIYGSLLYFFSLGAWGCVYAYTPEVYPTVARGSGTGWAAAFGRIGAFIAPMVVPVIYNSFGDETGFGYVFALLTGVFAFVAIVVAVFGKETMGKSLEEISE